MNVTVIHCPWESFKEETIHLTFHYVVMKTDFLNLTIWMMVINFNIFDSTIMEDNAANKLSKWLHLPVTSRISK